MRQTDFLLDAIDLAYQAALEPSLWPSVLVAATNSLQASRAVILYAGASDRDAMFSSQADEPLADTYFSEFIAINPIQQALNRLAGCAPPPVYSDQDLVPKPELLRTEFYDGFMRPADMHGVLLMPLGEGGSTTVNVFRSRCQEEFEGCDIERAGRLQRSLSRAWSMGQRLGAQRAIDEALADFIDRLPGAVMLVRADGRVEHANDAARTIVAARDGLCVETGVLEAKSLQPRARLRRLIGAAAARDPECRSSGAMSAPRPSGKRPYAILVSPARGEPALVYHNEPLALVCVSDLEAQPRLATRSLREVFGLTAAEAQIARWLFEGASLRETAEATGVSVATVRNQLARIFENTGVNRQATLISLMLRTVFADPD
jgi:DNA-binding CsgD family transcriptional regulator